WLREDSLLRPGSSHPWLLTMRAGDRRGARDDHRGPARLRRAGGRVRQPPGGARTVNPLTLSVIWGALQSIAVEIGTIVHRTAYSEQAREGQDFSVALFDQKGRMVAQGPDSPGHLGDMSCAVKNELAAHPLQ